MNLISHQAAYLRRVARLCGRKQGECADSRAVATAIGATEDERMDIENVLGQAGYMEEGPAPGTGAIYRTGAAGRSLSATAGPAEGDNHLAVDGDGLTRFDRVRQFRIQLAANR